MSAQPSTDSATTHSDKDARGHAVGRQAAHKPGDRLKGKAPRAKRGGGGGGGAGAGGGAWNQEDLDDGDDADDDADDDEGSGPETETEATNAPCQREVELVEIAQPSKRKDTKDDYEVVPHVRPVVALDDAMARSLELASPDDWERIEGDGEGTRTAPTYAEATTSK